jgi:ribonuclease J
VHAGMIFVDGVDIGDPDDVALRDRRRLSADGIFIVVVTVSADDGSSVAPPEVIFRGVAFLSEEDSAGLIEELRGVVEASIEGARRDGESPRDPMLLEDDLHNDIGAFVYERLRRRPMILPVVVEV